MRQFETLEEAIDEIRRDVQKGTRMKYSRVQQFTGLEMEGFERMPYVYSIRGGWPLNAKELVTLGRLKDFEIFNDPRMEEWLRFEEYARIYPLHTLDDLIGNPIEKYHPALENTLEGEYPSYVYPTRMIGAVQFLSGTLRANPDSRRAFWPIFNPQDSMRAAMPTRIPCSLGYQATIRTVGDHRQMMFFYLSRSVDFDTFWLTDVWLAHMLQRHLVVQYNTSNPEPVGVGTLTHFIISLHSFDNRKEVY